MNVNILRKYDVLKSESYDGIINIHSTFNNTIITLSRTNGQTIATSSGGTVGFKGSKRSTSYAAQVAAENITKKCNLFNIKTIVVYIKGIGDGRDAAIRSFANNTIQIISINDITPLSHNGCRPPKARRI